MGSYLAFERTKRQQRSQGVDHLGRFERARKRTENQKQQDEQKAMFQGLAELVVRESIAKLLPSW